MLLAYWHESGAIVHDACVYIETVNGIDAEGENLLGIFLAATRWSGENCHINVLQFCNVLNYLIFCQFSRFVLCAIASYDTSYFEIRCCFECLHRIMSDVAVTHYGCSNFLHFMLLFNSFVSLDCCSCML